MSMAAAPSPAASRRRASTIRAIQAAGRPITIGRASPSITRCRIASATIAL
jgi:hypothetical protein